MAAKKNASVQSKPTPKASPQVEIGTLYERELQTLNEELRRQAALAMFQKLQPNNSTTVDQFLSSLKEHKEVWTAVSGMGIVDFADAINDGKRLREMGRTQKGPALLKFSQDDEDDNPRTRLSEEQKQSLKVLIQKVLASHKEGLNRPDLAKTIGPDQAVSMGILANQLAEKLRQPLGELVHEGKIHTVGEKRLLKYLAGPKNGQSGKA